METIIYVYVSMNIIYSHKSYFYETVNIGILVN